MSITADVVVVGAGIVGASVARRTAEAGARVVVVERARPAGGTSLATFAWVNAVGKRPKDYFDLNVAGMEEHGRVAEELGDAAWRHGGGNLELASSVQELSAKAHAHRAWGYPVEMLDLASAAELEPDVAVPGAAAAAWYRSDSWVDPALLVRHLLDAPRVDLLAPAAAIRLELQHERIAGVVLHDGTRIAARTVAVCTGPDAGALIREVGFDLGLRDSPGLLATTEPAPVRVGRVIHVPGLAIRPDGAGRLLLASDELDPEMEPAGGALPVAAAAEDLMRRAVGAIPRLTGVAIESWRIGRRALTADGKPAVGPVPGCDGAYLAVMHSGITLGPLIGRLAAGELWTGSADRRLDPYRPDRFAAAVRREPDRSVRAG